MVLSNSMFPIMIVDDNEDDFEATRRALKSGNVSVHNKIIHCDNGDTALDYLFRRKEYAQTDEYPLPAVILLDLNMPGTDGHEVLHVLKTDPNLKRIPIVILTTSDYEKDIDRCYDAGANTYVKKPVNLDSFFEAIHRLQEYWFELALLPVAKGGSKH